MYFSQGFFACAAGDVGLRSSPSIWVSTPLQVVGLLRYKTRHIQYMPRFRLSMSGFREGLCVRIHTPIILHIANPEIPAFEDASYFIVEHMALDQRQGSG